METDGPGEARVTKAHLGGGTKKTMGIVEREKAGYRGRGKKAVFPWALWTFHGRNSRGG